MIQLLDATDAVDADDSTTTVTASAAVARTTNLKIVGTAGKLTSRFTSNPSLTQADSSLFALTIGAVTQLLRGIFPLQ